MNAADDFPIPPTPEQKHAIVNEAKKELCRSHDVCCVCDTFVDCTFSHFSLSELPASFFTALKYSLSSNFNERLLVQYNVSHLFPHFSQEDKDSIDQLLLSPRGIKVTDNEDEPEHSISFEVCKSCLGSLEACEKKSSPKPPKVRFTLDHTTL